MGSSDAFVFHPLDVGKRIKYERIRRHMTQECLAQEVGISPHYLYEVERGSKSATVGVLAGIAVSLEVSADYLIFGKSVQGAPAVDELDALLMKLSAVQRDSLAQIIRSMGSAVDERDCKDTEN